MADLIADLNNTVDPFRSLLPGDPNYVNCEAIRGDASVFQAVDALVSSNPEMILQLIQENQSQQGQRQTYEFELKKIELENDYKIKVSRDENKLKNIQRDRGLIAVGMGAFVVIFISSLVYAVRANDRNLPNTLITAAISLLAGGSTGVVVVSRRQGAGGEEEGAE